MANKIYDTLLFGNGLSIALLNKIKKTYQIETFDEFFDNFLKLEAHKRIKRDFYKILNSVISSEFYLSPNDIIDVENYLSNTLETIQTNGFEVFIGEDVFLKEAYLIKDTALYYYSLYNFWYNIINTTNKNEIQKIIEDFADKIKSKNFSNIYTTNFDNYLDKYLPVKHIHGEFEENLIDVRQMHVRCHTHKIESDGQPRYVICVGSNALEKLEGLVHIQETGYAGYDYSFLFGNNVNLGNLLIYGMRFADSLIIPKEILESYSDKNIDIVKYVDGHIMERLDALYCLGRLNSVTIACYFASDKERYERVFHMKKIKDIIEYVDCKNIF